MPFPFPRDKKGGFPLFGTKDFTDEHLDYFEALLGMTSSPAGLAKVVATRNNALLDLSGLVRFILAQRAASPFNVTPIPPTSPTGTLNLSVSLNSWLMNSIKASDTVTITGLGPDGAFACGTSAPWNIWLEADVRGLFATPPTPVLAKINHGTNWNSAGAGGLSVFPNVVIYNTDDGTPTGSTGTAPADVQQTTFIVPVAYLVDGSDPLGTAKNFGIQVASNLYLMQVLTTNLIMSGGCNNGATGFFASPYWGPIPPSLTG